MVRYPEIIPVESRDPATLYPPNLRYPLPQEERSIPLRPKYNLEEISGSDRTLGVRIEVRSPQRSQFKIPISPKPKLSIKNIERSINDLLKKEFKEVSLDGITKYRSPEDDKEEILVFIKVARHPYRVIKRIYAKLHEENPEIADTIVILPSFE